MKKREDIVFKIGLVLQVLFIPVAFLWHFSSEANYYNWVIAVSFVLVMLLFLWPQVLSIRVKRLKAIRIQLIAVIAVLILSWLAYAYFYHYTRANCTPEIMLHNGSGSSGQILQHNLGKNCYFGPATMTHVPSLIIYSVNWQFLFDRTWVMLLNPGASIQTIIGMTVIFLVLPLANLYRYQLDRKRIRGIKKEQLFS